MSTMLPVAAELPLTIPYQPVRMSVADYHKLISCGTLAENHRIELLRGVLVEKMTHNPLHAALAAVLQTILLPFFPPGFHLRCQLPITLSDSEPEPVTAIVRGDAADYFTKHPGPNETPLAIEISSTSLVTDRYKAEIYAEAAIPVYWIVNLIDRRVEVRSTPTLTAEGPQYAECRFFKLGDSIPVILDGREIGVLPAAKLLPVLAE